MTWTGSFPRVVTTANRSTSTAAMPAAATAKGARRQCREYAVETTTRPASSRAAQPARTRPSGASRSSGRTRNSSRPSRTAESPHAAASARNRRGCAAGSGRGVVAAARISTARPSASGGSIGRMYRGCLPTDTVKSRKGSNAQESNRSSAPPGRRRRFQASRAGFSPKPKNGDHGSIPASTTGT